jgi:hypothetical protein
LVEIVDQVLGALQAHGDAHHTVAKADRRSVPQPLWRSGDQRKCPQRVVASSFDALDDRPSE